MKKLPIGISTLGKIIDGNYAYVDKTQLVLQLAQSSDYFFLSRPRPRRFGKSLLISTLAEVFFREQSVVPWFVYPPTLGLVSDLSSDPDQLWCWFVA